MHIGKTLSNKTVRISLFLSLLYLSACATPDLHLTSDGDYNQTLSELPEETNLSEYRNIWESHGIKTYRLTLLIWRHHSKRYVTTYVKNGEIVSVSDLKGNDLELDSGYTVEKLYRYAERAKISERKPNYYYSAELSEEYGFVTQVSSNFKKASGDWEVIDLVEIEGWK